MRLWYSGIGRILKRYPVRNIGSALVGLSVFCLALAGAAVAPATAQEKCADSPALSAALHERIKAQGKSDAEISDILSSRFKRNVLKGRIADGSECNGDQNDKALEHLQTTLKG